MFDRSHRAAGALEGKTERFVGRAKMRFGGFLAGLAIGAGGAAGYEAAQIYHDIPQNAEERTIDYAIGIGGLILAVGLGRAATAVSKPGPPITPRVCTINASLLPTLIFHETFRLHAGSRLQIS